MPSGKSRTVDSLAAAIVRCAFLLSVIGNTCFAAQPPRTGLGAILDHPHAPIIVQSRPVIERLPVQVIEPTDICHSEQGALFVADRAAAVVFRLASNGDVAIAYRSDENITRIACDADDNLFVLSGNDGSSRVTHVTPTGKTLQLCTLPFPAVAFVRDDAGSMFAGSASGRLVAVNAEGVISDLCQLSDPLVDMTLSSSQQLQVLTSNRRVRLVGVDGVTQEIGFAQPLATRLFALPHGKLATLSPNPGGRPVIAEVNQNPGNELNQFAQVPQGTVAVSFDRLGNLSLANPDLRAVTRVTSHFTVPCPHCGQPVEMVLTTNPPDHADSKRSF